MGSPVFAVKSLDALHRHHEVLSVYTQPPRPSGRGMQVRPTAVAEYAGPQIGELKRLIVMDCSRDDEKSELWQMINPEVIELSEDNSTLEEGCLSIPGHTAEVSRPDWIKLRFTDIKGKEQQIKAEGLLAACIQHEIDHLNGILFIDHISKLKRDIIWRKVLKEARQT